MKLFCVIFLGLCLSLSSGLHDPYTVLGIRRDASAKEIKTAFRKKAKDTHPDKHPELDQDVSSNNFRRILDAYEILSDPSARKRYDLQFQHQRQRRERKQQQAQHTRNVRKSAIQNAQNSVMRVNSLEQLEHVMLDNDGRLEKNLLLAFVGNKQVERILDQSLLFPFPFAGIQDGIWWGDLMESVKVRYNAPSELTNFFRVPNGLDAPYVVFGRKGDRLDEFTVYAMNTFRGTSHFRSWVTSRLTTSFTLRNQHMSEVLLYMQDRKTQKHILVGRLRPGQTFTIPATIGQDYFVRDARVDQFPGAKKTVQLTPNSSLLQFVVRGYDETIDLQGKSCYDLSGSCNFWKKQNECNKSPEFMQAICSKTCLFCHESSFWTRLDISSQLSRSTSWIPPVFKSDFENVVEYRKNAAVILVACGFLLSYWLRRSTSRGSKRSTRQKLLLFSAFMVTFEPLLLLLRCSAYKDCPSWVDGLVSPAIVRDMENILELRRNVAALFVLIGFFLELAILYFFRALLRRDPHCPRLNKNGQQDSTRNDFESYARREQKQKLL